MDFYQIKYIMNTGEVCQFANGIPIAAWRIPEIVSSFLTDDNVMGFAIRKVEIVVVDLSELRDEELRKAQMN